MKYKSLKKRLLLEFAVLAVIFTLLGGLTYFLLSWMDENTTKRNNLQSEVSAVSNETNGLREKFIRVQKDFELYTRITSLNDTDMLSHSTAMVESRFKEYDIRFNLNKWSLDSTKSATALDPGVYQRKTHVISLRDATLDFEAVSDEDILNLLAAMQQEMSGAVSFTSLEMTRGSRLTDEALRTITQKGSFPLITGKAVFGWYALEPTDPEELKRQNDARNNNRNRRRRR
jgi:hypothetical protein